MLLCAPCREAPAVVGGALMGPCEMGNKCVGSKRVPNTALRICQPCAEHYRKCQQCGNDLAPGDHPVDND